MSPKSLPLTGDPGADALLGKDPLALLIGMVLDQQVPLEWAFAAPRQLSERLGGELDAAALASMDPEELVAAFSEKPALHRFPRSMAGRVQALCVTLVDRYGGEAAGPWMGVASGKELLSRIKELPGFGDQKARIFVAFLGKRLGVRPPGWEAASAPFGDPDTFLSVADIDSPESLVRVRRAKQEKKAAAKSVASKRT